MDLMNRDATLDFLSRHVQTDTLMKHLLTVEASMRGYARNTPRTKTAGASPDCSTISTGKSAPPRKAIPLTAPKSCATPATPRTSSAPC